MGKKALICGISGQDGTNTLEDFVAESFACVGLDWREHVSSDPALLHSSEIMVSRGNSEKAGSVLGWHARSRIRDVVRMMSAAERN